MKIFSNSVLLIISFLLISGCGGQGRAKKETLSTTDTVTAPDTGYTGIKQYMSGQLLIKEVTFKNGIREGLMKSFYQSGKLRQTFWYQNGLREDSAKWFYEEGQVFRTTPYKKDTIDGIQKQFFRNGKVKARLGYLKGFRTPFLQELTQDGKLVGGYPEVVVKI
jgi:antitoxin component YwqK of YwqJK toxin-antitoxin module